MTWSPSLGGSSAHARSATPEPSTPDATGVLVLGVGRATPLAAVSHRTPQVLRGEIVLGVETSTLDAAGDITATHDMEAVVDDDVRAAAAALTGPIMQIPPMVSAVKIDGRRLHELAREGKEVDRPPRPVTVHRFDVEPVAGDPGVWRCEGRLFVGHLRPHPGC